MERWLPTNWREIGSYGLGLLFLLFLPLLLHLITGIPQGYILYLCSLGLIYAIVAIGLNLLFGYAGQFSLGHAGFFAIGAYTSAVLTLHWGVPFIAAFLAAGFLTAIIGFLLGFPALRISGIYLAVATLGFGLAVPQFIVWQRTWTGGSMGLHNLPPAAIPLGLNRAFVFNSDRDYYFLVLGVLALLTIFAMNVARSDTGRAFIAIRDGELVARAMGVNLLRYKTTAFALSALYAGLAGSLYAHLLRGISPENFTLFLSIDFVTMVVLGGLGTETGALIGAFLLVLLENSLTRLPVLSEFKNLYIVALGAVLILIITFFPQGIVGGLRRLKRISPAPLLRRTTRPVSSTNPDNMAVGEQPSSSEGTGEQS